MDLSINGLQYLYLFTFTPMAPVSYFMATAPV